LQAVQTSRRHQERQHTGEDSHVLGLSAIDAHAHVPAAIDGDLFPATRRVQHHLYELRQNAGRRRSRNHADVEEAVRRRGHRREAEKPAIGLDVGDGDERRLARHGMAIDLDLDAIERRVGKVLRRHPIVREQPQVSLAWMSPEPLDFFLDARQKAVALVREEHAALGDADVAPD